MLRSISINFYRKKLSKLLGCTPLFDLVIAIWHIDRAQSGDFERAKFFNGIPEEAKTSELTSKYFIYKWSLEALLSQHFLTPASQSRPGKRFRILNLRQWSALATLITTLQKVENAESAVSTSRQDVFVELHRIAQRQFPWQRGFANKRLLLRYMYIYRNPETIDRFFKEYGLSLEDFSKLGFVFWAQFKQFSHTKTTTNFGVVEVSDEVRDAFLSRVSDTPESAQAFYAEYANKNIRAAHCPSRLRTHPLIVLNKEDGQYTAAPLPDLVFLRVTEGLFYDFVQFAELRESIANGFVEYCREFTVKARNDFEVVGEISYRKGRHTVRSPDLFLKIEDKIAVAIECKSRRMAHAAQFGVSPVDDAKSGFEEIAKGMVQLWRYIADSKQGLIPDPYKANEDTLLLLLTLDSWMDAPTGLKERIMGLANEIADKKGIPKNIRRVISFTSIADFEYVVERGTTDHILESLKAQSTEKYTDWMISGVFDDLFGQIDPIDPFTEADLEQHVPWWNDFNRPSN